MNTTPHQPAALADPTVPYPPRYWWLKRILLLLVFVLLATSVLYVIVSLIAKQRLADRIAEIEASGDPIWPADFNIARVPDEDNAWLVLQQAVEAFVPPNEHRPLKTNIVVEPGPNESIEQAMERAFGPRQNNLEYADVLNDPTLFGTQPADVQALLDSNREALDLFRAACRKPAMDYGYEIRTPMVEITPPSLFVPMQCARMACVAAIEQHRDGNDAEAVAIVREVLQFADNSASAQATILTGLAATVYSSSAVQTLEIILPTLTVAEPTTDGTGLGTLREDLEGLIPTLLDESRLHKGMVRAFCMERAWILDSTLLVTGDVEALPYSWRTSPFSPFRRALAFFFGPLLQVDQVRLLDGTTRFVRECEQPTIATMHAVKDPPVPELRYGKLGWATHVLSQLLLPDLYGTIENSIMDRAQRRLAAAAIAIRLYEIDHGDRPAALNDLVPDYLPYVPLDPASSHDEPILYFPNGPDARLAMRDYTALTYDDEAAASEPGEVAEDSTTVFRLNSPLPPKKKQPTTQSSGIDAVDQRDNVEDEETQPDGNQPADEHP